MHSQFWFSNQNSPICLKLWQDNKQCLSFFLSFLSVSNFVTKEPSPLAHSWWCRLTVVWSKWSTTSEHDQQRSLASVQPFTAPLGSRLNFHMEQEGELMLHHKSRVAKAAANLNQVRRTKASAATSALTRSTVPLSHDWDFYKTNTSLHHGHVQGSS